MFLCGYHEISTQLPKGSVFDFIAWQPVRVYYADNHIYAEIIDGFSRVTMPFVLYLVCQRSCVIREMECFEMETFFYVSISFFHFCEIQIDFHGYNIATFLFFLWIIIINSNAPISFGWTDVLCRIQAIIYACGAYINSGKRGKYISENSINYVERQYSHTHNPYWTSLLRAVDYYFGIRKKTSSLIVVI